MKKTASNSERWSNCGGYFSAAADYLAKYGKPPERSGTSEGTLAHSVAEYLIDLMRRQGDGTIGTPEVYKGEVIPKDMRTKVRDYAHFCFSLMRRANIYGGDTLWVEKEVECLFLEKGLMTRVDWAMYDPTVKRLFVIDLKYGHRPVEARDNTQLIISGRAILDGLRSRGEIPQSVSLSIYQPNGPNASMPLDQWDISPSDLIKASLHLEKKYHSSDNTLHIGKHCYYCEARGTCEALKHASYSILESLKEYTGLAEKIPVEHLERALDDIEVMETLLKAYKTGIEAICTSKLAGGIDFPNWEYTTSLTNRKWVYSDKEIIELGDSLDINLRVESVVSPAQAEAAGVPKEVVDTLVHRESTGLKLRKKSLKTLKQAFN